MYDSEGEDDEELLLALASRNATTTSAPSHRSSSSSSSTSFTSRPIITTSITTVPRPGMVSTSSSSSSSSSSAPGGQPDTKRPRRSATEETEADVDGGYNSDEERRQSMAAYLREGEGGGMACTLPEDERAFEEDLRNARGFTVKRMIGDGNCLFRAVADQIFGDSDMHDEVRKRCMDYMERERDHYSQFITEDFTEYIRRKRRDKEFGNHVEIQAISEIYNRPVEVYAYGHRDPINIFHKHYFTEYAPIRLSYHHGNHYNSVIDPENPSVGVGLGLPQSNPAAEIERAIEQSIEETMYKDVIEASEWEAAQKQLEDQVLLQSALEAGVVSDTAVGGVPALTNTDREGDIFMAGDEDDELAAALRQSELDYWESISRGS